MKDNCREIGHHFLYLYDKLYDVDVTLEGADTWGADLIHMAKILDESYKEVAALPMDNVSEEQRRQVESLIHKAKTSLPSVAGGFLRPPEIEDKLTQFRSDYFEAMDKLSEMMFDTVASCECKSSQVR